MRTMSAAAASALFKKQLRERRKLKKTRRRRTHLVRTCLWCFTPFSTARDHAKWCSNKCRTAGHRQAKLDPRQKRLDLVTPR